LLRKKGRVVVVGAVPTGFERDPHYYRKELELRMSCSYGPGRYDPDYEEHGRDYPAAYVRWTENRNMQAFQRLVYDGKIALDYLTTHEFPLERAAEAYEMILKRTEPCIGVVLKYDVDKPPVRRPFALGRANPVGAVNVAFLGAGSYAQSNLLPYVTEAPDVSLKGVMTNTGATSKRVAERFGFEFCTDSVQDVLANSQTNTVFVASRHDTHGEFAVQCLRAGKHVFVEKPLCLSEEELEEICSALRDNTTAHLMVGFNRRFAPLAAELKRHVKGAPVAMVYRINAGNIAPDSWIQDPEVGGGRIIGEVCHFVDLMTWMCGALPRSVHAVAMDDAGGTRDTVSINLAFENGSLGTICYFANGAKTMPKEHVEVYQHGITGVLSQFKELRIHGNGKALHRKSRTVDKGQREMIRQFLSAVRGGGPSPIQREEIVAVTRTTFAIVESLKTSQSIDLRDWTG
jgi:polar amino acid transport system substrate-binding protein